jgi:YbbR domain-containing protein
VTVHPIALAVWQRSARHWKRKAAALVLAFLMWLFVSTSETSIAQRSLLVPIATLGTQADQVVVGLPPFAEITVSGPTPRVDRLRPESFEAVIDLTGMTGNFQAPVVVTAPQGVTLERVNPGEVLGILERVTTKQVPVRVAYLGTAPEDVRLIAAPQPDVVTVRGRAPRLDRVSQVVVAIDAAPGERAGVPYAVDGAGRPIDQVTVEADLVTVTVTAEPVLVSRELPLELAAPELRGLLEAVLDRATVMVVGPPSRIESLHALAAHIDVPTEGLAGGRYTRPVRVAAPEGVTVVGDVTATVIVADPQPE